ncbi:hypothetical protein N6H05_11390 [Sphingobium sp. WTD-1]|uniref:hypothetical protein n=1 Tax=Sphingobium sp. WTD-1 TaxID=2979467 RepID=UPI0024DE00C6|nr:hypothetical protein [Sphingobium sp. WTD-1]WIA58362.1 hypothetical protein N6H05_11390 [Sphingobium sp. WTD-1]
MLVGAKADRLVMRLPVPTADILVQAAWLGMTELGTKSQPPNTIAGAGFPAIRLAIFKSLRHRFLPTIPSLLVCTETPISKAATQDYL